MKKSIILSNSFKFVHRSIFVSSLLPKERNQQINLILKIYNFNQNKYSSLNNINERKMKDDEEI